jgi:Domain of unknown function (DUF4429)/Short C-terminal domain
MIEVKGRNGQVSFDGQCVTITRKGLLARSSIGKGEKRLPINQIAAIQWKPAGWAWNGFIQFTVPGGNEQQSAFGNRTMRATKDENSVMFTKKQMPEFERLRAAIDEAIARQHVRQAAGSSGGSIADELAKLAALREQGVITDADFEAGKAKLLGTS